MKNFVAVLMIFGVASVGYAVVIGDFEGASLDGWEGDGNPNVVVAFSTTAGTVTRGSQSIYVDPSGGFYRLKWYAPSVPTVLTALSFDFSMIASDFPGASYCVVPISLAPVTLGGYAVEPQTVPWTGSGRIVWPASGDVKAGIRCAGAVKAALTRAFQGDASWQPSVSTNPT